METYVISICRQFGSLGRPVAKRLSELLHITYYDRDIVDKTAEKLKLPTSVINDAEEMAENRLFLMKYPLGNGTSIIQNQIWNAQKQIIRELANKESCIIVGRCSDYILAHHKNCIRIFIYAPYEERLRNCIEALGMDKRTAKRMISQVDTARKSYHMTYAHYEQEDIRHKDILINSSLLGAEGTAHLLYESIIQKLTKAGD